MSEEKESKQLDIQFKKETHLSLDMIRGQDHIKEELKQLHTALSNLDTYYAMGADLPKGILFVGGPGLGKTMAARAIAKDAPVSIAIIKVSDVVSVLVDGRAVNLKKMFEKISEHSKNEPVVVIIDELEFMTADRSKNTHHDGSRSAVNLLLEWMDGVEQNGNIIIIGCTNIIKNIDPAILRSGRFDKKIFFNELKPEDIAEIIIDNVNEKVNKQAVPLLKVPAEKDKNKLVKLLDGMFEKYYINGADARLCVVDVVKDRTIELITKYDGKLDSIRKSLDSKTEQQIGMDQIASAIEKIAKNNHEVTQAKKTRTFNVEITQMK